MPLYHCLKCHHEWESVEEEPCDWCGGGCRELGETDFERAARLWQEEYKLAENERMARDYPLAENIYYQEREGWTSEASNGSITAVGNTAGWTPDTPNLYYDQSWRYDTTGSTAEPMPCPGVDWDEVRDHVDGFRADRLYEEESGGIRFGPGYLMVGSVPISVLEAHLSYEAKGANEMEEYLTDLAVGLGLTKKHVAEIRKVLGDGGNKPLFGWMGRLCLYQLATMVKAGDITAEALGYKEDPK